MDEWLVCGRGGDGLGLFRIVFSLSASTLKIADSSEKINSTLSKLVSKINLHNHILATTYKKHFPIKISVYLLSATIERCPVPHEQR